MINKLDPSNPTVGSRLLAELSEVIDHSSLAREIVDKSRHVRSIEQTSGPSRRTQALRQEIASLEDRLNSVCERNSCLNSGISFKN